MLEEGKGGGRGENSHKHSRTKDENAVATFLYVVSPVESTPRWPRFIVCEECPEDPGIWDRKRRKRAHQIQTLGRLRIIMSNDWG